MSRTIRHRFTPFSSISSFLSLPISFFSMSTSLYCHFALPLIHYYYNMMMSFCEKRVHSFLALIALPINHNYNHRKPNSNSSSSCSGLGLLTVSDDAKQSNVLESATFKPPPSVKKDPGGIGFIDDAGDCVNGLMSCTESLGFESCDARRTDDDEIDDLCSTSISSSSTSTNTTTVKIDWRRNSGERKAAKKFPPPLSSLNNNGRRSYFLRPERKNGRLELVEVRLERPEILRASREDGRLRLHLVQEEDEDNKVEEQRGKQELEDGGRQEGEGGNGHRTGGEWRFPVTGEGYMRCYDEMAAHHHHRHNLHVESALREHKVEQIFVN